MFPCEDDRADVRAAAGEPVREAVAREEERTEKGEPGECAARHAHSSRTASDTVKMPHSSMRCAILRKPARAVS